MFIYSIVYSFMIFGEMDGINRYDLSERADRAIDSSNPRLHLAMIAIWLTVTLNLWWMWFQICMISGCLPGCLPGSLPFERILQLTQMLKRYNIPVSGSSA